MTEAPAKPKIDLLDPASFYGSQPHDQFRWLRSHEPVHRHPKPDGGHFWALTRHADVRAVGRDHQTFSNAAGGIHINDMPPEGLEMARRMMLYPIRVLDPERVKVLVRSKELEGKYGEAPVAVLFDYGRGEVFHMISHYYLQRTELRDARHAAPAETYAAEKGVVVANVEIGDLQAGDVESAASSARLITNVIAQKKRKKS